MQVLRLEEVKPWPVNYCFLEKEERVLFLPVRRGESAVRPLWVVPGFYLA
jgi:hypothetical protein